MARSCKTVAYLGSIDRRDLGMAPDEKRDGISIRARVAFWEAVNPKLKALANRLGREAEVKRLRMAIHARIPGPMQPERARLEVLDAKAEGQRWHGLYELTQRRIANNDKSIARDQEENRELRQEARRQIDQANMWLAEAENLRKRSA